AGQAGTREFRAAGRMRLSNLFGRALRLGATEVEIDWLTVPLWARIRYGAQWSVRCLVDLLSGILCWLPSRAFALRRLVAATSSAGRVGRLLGWRYHEYGSMPGRNAIGCTGLPTAV